MSETSLAPTNPGGPPQLPAAPDSSLAIIDMMKAAMDKPDAVIALEKLVPMFERLEARQAEKSFNAAMAAFQADCPPVHKRRQVDSVSRAGSRTKYSFASKSDILTEIQPHLTVNGLSVTFSNEEGNQSGNYRAICIVRHIGGHSTSTPFEGPIDSGHMSDIQKRGSTQSYYERYAMCAALGIVVSDIEDDDGRGKPTATITCDQADELDSLINNSGADRVKFLAWCVVPDVESIPANRFAQAKTMLLRKMDKRHHDTNALLDESE